MTPLRAVLWSTALLLVGGGEGRATLSPSPARLLVTAREYDLTLSRAWLRTGRAVIELHNLGEDEHDLALRRVGPSASTKRIRTTAPGRLRDLEVSLRPGRYWLWCTLLDHRARGMRATMVVRP